MFILRCLAVYLPFEEFILKWLPVSDLIYSLLRQVPDILIFGLMSILVLERILSGRLIPIIGGRVDFFLAMFVCWAFMTILLNPGADAFLGIANIKALLRYVLLIYIVLLLNPTGSEIEKIVRWLWFVVVAQICIGLFQLIGGIPVRDFLAARHVSEGIGGMVKTFTGDRFEGVNDLMGTMGDTISYGYFLMIGLVIWIFKKPSRGVKEWIITLLFIGLIYLSGSKAIFLSSIMILIGYLVWLYGWRRVCIWTGFVLPVVAVFMWSAVSNEMVADIQADSSRLLQGLMNSRLGIMVYILPELFLSPHSIIGFSPDKYFFTEIVVTRFPMIPSILVAILPLILEDVYWVAMQVYFGWIGFFCWLFFLVILYRRIKSGIYIWGYFRNKIAVVAMVLILVAIPLNLLNQAFEVRTFSFYLWLFCGFALVKRRQAIKSWSMR